VGGGGKEKKKLNAMRSRVPEGAEWRLARQDVCAQRPSTGRERGETSPNAECVRRNAILKPENGKWERNLRLGKQMINVTHREEKIVPRKWNFSLEQVCRTEIEVEKR